MSKDDRKIRFGLWYDFRNPTQWHQSADRLYAETLDQIAWGENHGFADVWLSQHHFLDDGYLPSILPVAAAIAARTKRIRIASGVLLMPFHNPVRLAEDIAVVDVISGGRLELGVGGWLQARRVRRVRGAFQGTRCANKSITRNHSSSSRWRDRNLQERILRLQEC
jgi:alkanesulfonate monooxygenase SsuD/methylene tetrahydromethanopterin reductase-like flavin-dependent oxidoreductase (luciferase family)